MAQGWNWELAKIKSYVAKYQDADVYVGQIYRTASGLTEIDITVTKVTGLSVVCNMVGNKNWGDGTQNDATTHTYTDYGDYTITCDGTAIPEGTTSSGGMFESTSTNQNKYWCTAIRVGGNVTSIGTFAFNYCYSLTSVTIPDSASTVAYAFYNCYSLTSVTIPDSVTRIGDYAFYNCYSLTSVLIPDSVTSIDGNAFRSCYSLTSVTIPDSASISTYAFYNCYSLTSVTIPDSVTRIGDYVFYNCYSLTSVLIPDSVTRIGDSAFRSCYSLTSVLIPDSVTRIDGNAFRSCYSVVEYNFSRTTTAPSLTNTSAFSDINGICKIKVPAALYNNWITATNWATYADYIVAV